jgi:hypothetical protein
LDAPDYSNALFNEVFLQELSHFITPRGVGLEGCPYSKNHKQKTARSNYDPNRFLFLLLFLTLFPLTS